MISDKELREGLEDPPLSHPGFTPQLGQRIRMAAAQASHSRRHRYTRRLPRIISALTLCMLTALLLVTVLQQHAAVPQVALDEASNEGDAASASLAADAERDAHAAVFRSAVLIGLRQDVQIADVQSRGMQAGEAMSGDRQSGTLGGDSQGGTLGGDTQGGTLGGDTRTVSSYRTVLVAPVDGRLQRIAEGPEILMPYKTEFWRITPSPVTVNGQTGHILTAGPADRGVSTADDALAAETAAANTALRTAHLLNEKLLFVGHQNLAVEQHVLEAASGDANDETAEEASTYFWVKHIEQLTARTAHRDPEAFDPLTEPHVKLQEVFPAFTLTTQIHTNQAANWTIVRKPGSWTALQVLANEGLSSEPPYVLWDVALPLPQDVASFDSMDVSWELIREREPGARDAFASPEREVLIVELQDRLSFYPLAEVPGASPALELELRDREQVIMMQWATGDYVARWKQEAAELLGGYAD